MSENNPLQKYFRRPELFISLPSKGRWWNNESLILPPNNELAIFPMSGSDDLAMRNADGLMNGSTTVEVIQSCCPSIKNAWLAPMIDLDYLLIAVRIASYGSKMEFDSKCEKCEEENSYSADLRWVLENIAIPNYDQPFEIENGMFVFFKPDTFDRINKNKIEAFQQQRTIQAISVSNMPDEEKIERIRKDLVELTKHTSEKIASQIDKIITAEGETVSNYDFIYEFVKNANREVFNNISDEIIGINKQYKLPSTKVKCNGCGHEENKTFTFEPSSFFGKSS